MLLTLYKLIFKGISLVAIEESTIFAANFKQNYLFNYESIRNCFHLESRFI